MAHPPILAFGYDGLTRVQACAVLDVSPIVVVAHQCCPVPTDLACGLFCEADSSSHCFCTSRSTFVGISPDGANSRDGTGSSSVNGLPPPRAARSATITPV